jgi:hypothetical protein
MKIAVENLSVSRKIFCKWNYKSCRIQSWKVLQLDLKDIFLFISDPESSIPSLGIPFAVKTLSTDWNLLQLAGKFQVQLKDIFHRDLILKEEAKEFLQLVVDPNYSSTIQFDDLGRVCIEIEFNEIPNNGHVSIDIRFRGCMLELIFL